MSPLASALALASGIAAEPAAAPSAILDPSRRLVSHRSVRLMTGLSRSSLERAQRRGELVPVYLGRDRRFDLAAVERFVWLRGQARQVTGAGAATAEARSMVKAREASELKRLEAAALGLLNSAGLDQLGNVLRRFAPDGKLASIPRERRAAAIKALGAAK